MANQKRMNVVSPLDGRYAEQLGLLPRRMSEGGLIRYRVMVECHYLMKLCNTPETRIRPLTEEEKEQLEKFSLLTNKDLNYISELEHYGVDGIPPVRHDVKAVEYYLKGRLARTSMKDLTEYVHFALTSEDINNISYALMLRDCLNGEMLPALEEILKVLDGLARTHAADPLLARTHGQPAVPTTFGKEFRVFHARIARQADQLRHLHICAKLNGAAGNYNAHTAAFPDVDWIKFSNEFIKSFNPERGPMLENNLFTTQIEPHDSYAELFDALRRANTVLLGFCQDMWRYISAGLVVQKAVAGEVGSSTMPQKVNPIHFENAEGNLGMANAMLMFFSTKLTVSRLQRDLSDSTVERNFGAAFGHSLAAYRAVLAGLGRVSVNADAARAELELHPEVVAEGIQTVLRREKAAGPYELLCEFTRGRDVTAAELSAFLDGLKLKPAVKAELKRLSPLNYTGLAAKIARLH